MIVITGASEGLGLEVAKLYKNDDKKIVNISLTDSIAADINMIYDLSEGKQIEMAAKDVIALNEPLDVLINCAGVWTNEPIGKITEKEIKQTMVSNVKSTILLTSNLIAKIKKDGSDVANISSIAGTKNYTNECVVYSASKWAVRGFSANLQRELKDTKCRVISFCPDGFHSKLMEKVTGKSSKERKDLMNVSDVALLLKQILDLPKNMEVSEVVITKKGAK
ncbi:hypothetical protein A3F37_01225 [Candidatus Saccharibacteria bacterium RIFCSPHIGHO2_12_FULL_41_12]|nr:MAG: hypothetical protein A3F37_01225 [Candidatus Saccharibacteria bacterium RIFCSPHIGHO2_12_FULL_41_12]